jgi:uncharacterized membrane protein YqaE (UPF0057 family)
MRFWCIFFPPFAALAAGGIGSFLVNCFLTALGIIPGVIHAWGVVTDRQRQDQHRELMVAMAAQAKRK